MQTTMIDGIERNAFDKVNFDITDKMAVLNKSFFTRVKPENGVYGITETVKENGLVERLSQNEWGYKRKEYIQDGVLKIAREKIDSNKWCTTRYDDNGTAYVKEIAGKERIGFFKRELIKTNKIELTPGIEIKKGNFTAQIDNLGRPIVNKITDLQICPGRENLSSKLTDNSYRQGDHKGHLIADIFGGPASKENVVAQMSEVNQSEFKKIENRIKKLKAEGHSVDYEVKTNYADKTNRPSSFEITVTVDGKINPDITSDFKKIYNDNHSMVGKAVTTVKEHVNNASTKISPFHKAGVEEGLEAAIITCAVSTVDNVVKFSEGEITAEEMVVDIAKDTGTAGALGYGTGFVTKVIATSMKGSTNTMVQSLGKLGVPAAIVSFGVESYDTVMDFAQGDIDLAEFAYDLGENAASVSGSAVGAGLAGAAVGSVVPGAGTAVGFVVAGGASLVGGMVGTAVATGAYRTAIEAGSAGAEVLADKAHEVAKGTLEVAKEYMPENVDEVRNALNTFLAENKMPFSV